MTKPPKALVPAPLVQKEPPAGYSYQQINCLDSIIRCVSVHVSSSSSQSDDRPSGYFVTQCCYMSVVKATMN